MLNGTELLATKAIFYGKTEMSEFIFIQETHLFLALHHDRYNKQLNKEIISDSLTDCQKEIQTTDINL